VCTPSLFSRKIMKMQFYFIFKSVCQVKVVLVFVYFVIFKNNKLFFLGVKTFYEENYYFQKNLFPKKVFSKNIFNNSNNYNYIYIL